MLKNIYIVNYGVRRELKSKDKSRSGFIAR